MGRSARWSTCWCRRSNRCPPISGRRPANAIAQAQDLARRGPIVAPAVRSGAIQVVAGVYNIANGAVSIVR
jgi:hypothetical protein